MKDIHIRIIKEFLDEMIVNEGVLKLEFPEKKIHKIKLDYLAKLAFKFYRKLHTNSDFTEYLQNWKFLKCKYCPDKCDYFLELEKQADVSAEEINSLLTQCKQPVISLTCLNCDASFHTESNYCESQLPLCSECRDLIGKELEVWKKVFD
ncbi:MAG: hypothetical protein PHR06_06185 [Candidatus Cloacimonetes bacterium]|nr:hypothetical protein [Candidatus Cloacimonadota bacterium]